MEKYTEINQKIAKNLTYYRKAAGLTQAELAEKINYSDKSVSKWESGNGVPDVYILLELAKLYKISLNDLVGEEPPKNEENSRVNKKTFRSRLLIMLLSVGIVWLVATFLFVTLELIQPKGDWWIFFVYAVPCSAILFIVYAGIWKYRLLNFTAVSLLIWSFLTCVYLSLFLYGEQVIFSLSTYENPYAGYWLLYLIGIPLQVLEILWVFFRSLFTKGRRKEVASEPEQNAENAEKVDEKE
jgi:transcriptional regulator with XRE-family HTH domain